MGEKISKHKNKQELIKDLMESFSLRWEFTRRDPGYKDKCDLWRHLRENGKKKANRIYIESLAEYDFPPLDYDKELCANFREQQDIISRMKGAQLGRFYYKKPFNKKHPYLHPQTFNFMATHGQNAVWNVTGFSEGRLLSSEEAQKMKPLIFTGKPPKSRTVQIELNLTYPKDLILTLLGGLIESWSEKRANDKKKPSATAYHRNGVTNVSFHQTRIDILNTRKRNSNYKRYIYVYKHYTTVKDPIQLATDEDVKRDKYAARRKVIAQKKKCEQIIKSKEYLDIR